MRVNASHVRLLEPAFSSLVYARHRGNSRGQIAVLTFIAPTSRTFTIPVSRIERPVLHPSFFSFSTDREGHTDSFLDVDAV